MDSVPCCTRTEPRADGSVPGDQVAKSAEQYAADRLLLGAKVVFEQLVAGNVSGVDATNSMVHQQARIESGLPQVIAPLRQNVPSAYAGKFSGKYEHRTIVGGIGHNSPQEAPQAFAKAVVEADSH